MPSTAEHEVVDAASMRISPPDPRSSIEPCTVDTPLRPIEDFEFYACEWEAWLRAMGGTAAVRDQVVAWLNNHGVHLKATFVYRAWLDSGGDVQAVRAPLVAWVRAHGETPQATFVYKGWLGAGGDVEAVADTLVNWTKAHGEALEAGFVYAAWLKAGASPAVVAQPLARWLSTYGQHHDAGFVYRAWFDHPRYDPVIRNHAYGWFHIHRQEPIAALLGKHLATDDSTPASVKADLLHWLRAFPDHEDAFWRLGQLLSSPLQWSLRAEALEALELLLNLKVFSATDVAPIVVANAHMACLWACQQVALSAGPEGLWLDDLLVELVRFEAAFGPGADLSLKSRAYANRLVSLVVSGKLTVFRDRRALVGLLAWMRRWEATPRALIGGAIGYLNHELEHKATRAARRDEHRPIQDPRRERDCVALGDSLDGAA